MGFFDAVGKVINPKNILTGVGTVVGGPLGAAGGRALGEATFGDDWDWRGEDAGGIGDVVLEGGMGAGMGYLAPSSVGGGGGFTKGLESVGLIGGSGGGGGAATSAAGDSARQAISSLGSSGGTQAAAQAAGQGLSTMDKVLLGSSAAQGLGSIVGNVQQGQVMEERRKRRERLAQLLQPYLQESLQAVGEDL